MTDPDNHCANRNLRANTVVVPPLHFESGGMRPGGMGSGGIRPGGDNQTAAGSSERPIRQPATAADSFSMVIPETVLPEGWDAPLQNPMPRMVPPAPAPMYRRNNNMLRSINQPIVAIPEIHVSLQNPMPRMMLPPSAPVYRGDSMLRPVNQPIVAIPGTVLLEGWDAPLQNPIPRIVPPLPAPALRRVRNVRQEQSLAILQEQQRLRHVAMAEEQERQQALAVLEEQQRLRNIVMVQTQERQQQALATLHQERRQEFRLEDFNGLNPQNDIPPEEELEYVDAPPLGQIVENALEYLQQPADNGDDPRQEDPPDDLAVHIPAEEVEPPLDPAIPEMNGSSKRKTALFG
ncbi:hypothetical protein C0995_009195 [Termitomyces sp. Mi166|nr:hypothetical protein C0995_009195 [Termitomyces sp. Mi166\